MTYNIKTILAKETLGLLKTFQRVSPRSSLATIYKSFVRPHLDLVISSFFQAFHNSFHQRMESIQYDAALAIMRTIRGTSKERLPGTRNNRFFTKKIIELPSYLFDLISKSSSTYCTQCTFNRNQSQVFQKQIFPFGNYRMEQVKLWYSCVLFLFAIKKRILEFIRHHKQGI